MATMSGLGLATLDDSSYYYVVAVDGNFKDGHKNLKIAMTTQADWEPALDWRMISIATIGLVKWDDEE